MAREQGIWHLFFEVMNRRTGQGEIALATSRDGARWDYRQQVLVEPFHLSYPYVFRWENDCYMVPESYQAGAVRLYRAEEFPARWACVANLLEGPFFADASVCHHDGRWWLFVDTSPGINNDTLRLFHADKLSGPWREHPRSPLIDGNACRARPGGRVLVHAGRVIRFAQRCLPYYGTEVHAFEIDKLTPTAYHEREVEESPILKPSGAGWNACGMHRVDAHLQDNGQWLACVDGWSSELIMSGKT
jgi:hypothetical protein